MQSAAPKACGFVRIRAFLLVAALLFPLQRASVGQIAGRNPVLSAPVGNQTAVRFFWFGDMDSHFREPMDFYTVSATDPRLHTVEMPDPNHLDRPWTTFVTVPEMKHLIGGLESLNLNWVDSSRREAFGNLHPFENSFLDITVLTSKGTAKGYIRIARMCDQLATLDSAMPTPRIRWQFQLLRVDDGCIVPGFFGSEVPRN